jgi:tetratricopeptide (TPR) repeat protein
MRKLALEAEPALPENLTFWANRLRLTGALVQAEREFDQAIFLDSGYVEAYMQLAVYQRVQGRLEEAIETYKIALRRGPRQGAENLLAWQNMGTLYEELGDLEEAERHVRKGLSIDPDYLQGWVALSRILTKMGRDEEAIKAWRRVIRMAPYGIEARMAQRNIHYLETGEVPPIEEE